MAYVQRFRRCRRIRASKAHSRHGYSDFWRSQSQYHHQNQLLPVNMAWARLNRFVDNSGRTLFGEPCIESAEELTTKLEKGELYALELKGSSPFDLSAPGEEARVKSLVAVLNPKDVPTIKCNGWNYMEHSKT